MFSNLHEAGWYDVSPTCKDRFQCVTEKNSDTFYELPTWIQVPDSQYLKRTKVSVLHSLLVAHIFCLRSKSLAQSKRSHNLCYIDSGYECQVSVCVCLSNSSKFHFKDTGTHHDIQHLISIIYLKWCLLLVLELSMHVIKVCITRENMS